MVPNLSAPAQPAATAQRRDPDAPGGSTLLC
jgi:hypothetical protein